MDVSGGGVLCAKSNQCIPEKHANQSGGVAVECFHGFRASLCDTNPGFTQFVEIASGNYGRVYKAICKRCCTVAIKQCDASDESVAYEKRCLQFLSEKKRPNIIEYFGCYTEGTKLNYLFEMGDMSLLDCLKILDRKLDKLYLNNIFHQILGMVHILVELDVHHRDFSFKNIVYFFAAMIDLN